MTSNGDISDEAWRRLCYFWSSDFRTHITETRWQALLNDLPAAPTLPEKPDHVYSSSLPPNIRVERLGRFLQIEAGGLHLILNAYRGLAIQAFGYGNGGNTASAKLNKGSVIGTLEHGFFEDIAYGADFYSGHYVLEPPGAHKVTDLGRCTPELVWNETEQVLCLTGTIQTQNGEIRKTLIFDPAGQSISVSYDFSKMANVFGTKRLAHVTLNPKFFSRSTLFYAVGNGGDAIELHPLAKDGRLLEVDHGKPVSRLVSASTATGMTCGRLFLGDEENIVGIEMKRTDCAGVGMITSANVRDSFFVRGCVSVSEFDETRRPAGDQLGKKGRAVDYLYRIFLDKTSNLL